jgi:iron complex transport system ATP-binding protein
VLGPNGAGKSTLLSILGSYAHPTCGRLDILGRRLGRVDVFALRPQIGQVNPRLPVEPVRTVREVVLTGATGNSSLVPRWTPRVDELGERARTLIARALMAEPALLLLDEPTAGLDVAGREQLLASLAEMRFHRPRVAIVLVTHHLEELPASTSHALLLRAGRMLAAGPADHVLTSELVSACFDHAISIRRQSGLWAAVAGTPGVRQPAI